MLQHNVSSNPEISTSYSGGGLAPWQHRRCLELMHRHLRGGLRLATLARECRLSSSQFARSFKRSFGITVHQYLLSMRVEAAKTLLSHKILCLTEIALETGFSDQAAFNRTFKAMTGTTPGRWRRANLHESSAKKDFVDERAA